MAEEELQEVVEDPDETEEELQDPEVAARRAAAMAFIRRYGDPVLKSRATPVDRFDAALRDQVARMSAIMRDAIGVGLAAPQVGLSQRLLVYQVGHDAPVIAVVNPEIEWTSEGEESLEEGCLSLPGVHIDVDRPIHVRVRAQDEHGDTQLIEASGLEARVLQHEIDHLNGVLILEHGSREQRKEAIRILRDEERERSEQAA
jgi:peptide deformylase